MRSKTSKSSKKAHSLWKEEQNCSEQRVLEIAGELALHLRAGDRVFLEGEMGAGKSTFARAILNALGVRDLAEGSPTFAIAHEYVSFAGEIVHLDLYRLKSDDELESAGVLAYFWERVALVLVEWGSQFPSLKEQVIAAAQNQKASVFEVSLAIAGELEKSSLRNLEIRQLGRQV